MKKTIAYLLLIPMVFSLCSCGKSEEVKNVESMIAAIGDISLESRKSIKDAEKAYEALIEEDKEDVDTYNVLLEARNSFDSLVLEQTESLYKEMDAFVKEENYIDAIKVWEVNSNKGLYLSDNEQLKECYQYAQAMDIYYGQTELSPGELKKANNLVSKNTIQEYQIPKLAEIADKVDGTYIHRGMDLGIGGGIFMRSDLIIELYDDTAKTVIEQVISKGSSSKTDDSLSAKYTAVCILDNGNLVKVELRGINNDVKETLTWEGNTLISKTSDGIPVKYYKE